MNHPFFPIRPGSNPTSTVPAASVKAVVVSKVALVSWIMVVVVVVVVVVAKAACSTGEEPLP